MVRPEAGAISPSSILGVLGLAAFIAYIWWTLSAIGGVTCEVCVEFKGRVQCASGTGKDRDDAIKSGHTPACKLLANGVTESFQCSATPARDVSCTQ